MTTELVEPNHQVNYDNIVVNNIAITGDDINKTNATILYVPLKFLFNKNHKLAIPYVAMFAMNEPLITLKRNKFPKSKM
jgi:hypothetical protein